MSNLPVSEQPDDESTSDQFRMLALMGKQEEDKKTKARHEEEIFSDNISDQLKGTRKFKNILTTQEGYKSLEGAVIQKRVELLRRFLANDNEEPALQHEAACALANLASWTTEIFVADIPFYVDLSHSKDDIISEQAFKMLGKLARDSVQTRDLLLGNRAMDSVLAHLEMRTNTSRLRRVAETMSVLYLNRPILSHNKVIGAVIDLQHIICEARDGEVLYWSCRCIYHLSKGINGELQRLINMRVCTRLTQLLAFHNFYIVTSAVSAVESIVGGDTTQTKEYHEGLIRPLCNLLRKITDSFVLSKTLDTLFTILNAADMAKASYVNMIANEGGWDIIEKLRDHEDNAISHRAKQMIEILSVEQGGDGIEPGVPFLTRVVPFLTQVSPLLIVVLLNMVPFLTRGEPVTDSGGVELGSISDSAGSISDSGEPITDSGGIV